MKERISEEIQARKMAISEKRQERKAERKRLYQLEQREIQRIQEQKRKIAKKKR